MNSYNHRLITVYLLKCSIVCSFTDLTMIMIVLIAKLNVSTNAVCLMPYKVFNDYRKLKYTHSLTQPKIKSTVAVNN